MTPLPHLLFGNSLTLQAWLAWYSLKTGWSWTHLLLPLKCWVYEQRTPFLAIKLIFIWFWRPALLFCFLSPRSLSISYLSQLPLFSTSTKFQGFLWAPFWGLRRQKPTVWSPCAPGLHSHCRSHSLSAMVFLTAKSQQSPGDLGGGRGLQEVLSFSWSAQQDSLSYSSLPL